MHHAVIIYNNHCEDESIILQTTDRGNKISFFLHQDACSCEEKLDAAGFSKVSVSWQKQ